jgi:phospholipase C
MNLRFTAGNVCNFLVLLLILVFCLSVDSSPGIPNGFEKIQHIVFIIKENRTFDHYFGTFPGVAGATSATLSNGQTIALEPAPDALPHDIGHSRDDAVEAINHGKMDRFDWITNSLKTGNYLPFTQMREQDIPNYFSYARHFVLADHMFSSLAGPSFPNHLYIMAGQADGSLENPKRPKALGPKPPPRPGHPKPPPFRGKWGCDADEDSRVEIVEKGKTVEQYPCFDFVTIVDRLESAGISWKYYAPKKGESGYQWSSLDAIKHIRNGPLWNSNVRPEDEFLRDVRNGRLPAVSWLVTGVESEHPPMSTCGGENWSVLRINAIMRSPLWESTAIFITWDDFGGFYDHMPPPKVDRFGYGPRVPLLIVSPYAKQAHIAHTLYEFSSFLKFVELRFGLPPLTDRDSSANSMLDSFDFAQKPLPPLLLRRRTCQ